MKCRDLQLKISDFLENNLNDHELEQFLDHVEECQSCYDDLEVYYVITEGLLQLDEKHSGTLDFKKNLQKLLKEKRQTLYARKRKHLIRKRMTDLSVICIIGILVFSLHIFSIGSGTIHTIEDFQTVALDTIRQSWSGISNINIAVEEKVAETETETTSLSPIERRLQFEEKHPFIPSYLYLPNAGLYTPNP